MKLEIGSSIKSRLRNCYKITVDFSDADGSEELEFFVSDMRYSHYNDREEMHDFIKHIQSCITIDNEGRGGFENADECVKWYGLGLDYGKKFTPAYQWGRFCEDGSSNYSDLANELPDLFDYDSDFTYCIPTYSDGWYASYQNITIVHIDENGDICDVKIIDDEN